MAGVFHVSDVEDSTYGETWDHYTYDGKNRIINDTSYLFPLIIHGHPTLDHNGSIFYFTYEYDSENRVIAVHETGDNGIRNFTSSYDKEGNLVGVAHDHQVNFHRTNKIWQFLDKDYSMNNPLPNTYTYNSFGLPVKAADGVRFFAYDNSEADIRYSCK